MYTLYYSPGACSMAVHVALNEIGAEFKLEQVNLAEGKNRSPEYLKLNPRGQVPVLVDGNQVIKEGAAILIHLLEKHNNPLLPSSGSARTETLEWLMFCNSTLHPAYARVFFLTKAANISQEAKDQLFDTFYGNINKLWNDVEERLQNKQYLAGDNLTIADILLAVIANWSRNFPQIKIGEKTKQLLQKVVSKPSYKTALEKEQVEYKAAA